MDIEIVTRCKKLIEQEDLLSLQQYYRELMITEFERDPDWPYIFQKVYLHACLKGKAAMAEWIHKALVTLMDPIQQNALIQIFPYGRYLLSKAKKPIQG